MGRESKGRKFLIRFIILMLLLIAACITIIVLKEKFRVTNIEVFGNDHYSVEEIKDIVLDGPYGDNSIYLYMKYHDKTIDNIPFIEKMNVTIKSPTNIRIDVYEKAMAGYIEYLGHFIYFDREGIAVESSLERIDGIPFVTGLDFDHVVLHEKLPVDDQNIFSMILNITQLLTKYEIPTDRIYFDNDKNVTLYFGNARVYIGTFDFIDEKINELHLLLPNLEGRSGVLHMEGYKGEGGSFTFNKDDESNSIDFDLTSQDNETEENDLDTTSSGENENG